MNKKFLLILLSTLLFISSVFAVSDIDILSRTTAYYTFLTDGTNSISGGIDIIPYNSPVHLNNNSCKISSYGCYDLNGAQFLNLTKSNEVISTGKFSIAFWTKPQTTDDYDSFFGMYDDSSANKETFVVNIRTDVGNFYVNRGRSGANPNIETTATDFRNAWHFIVINNNGLNNLTIYVDGVFNVGGGNGAGNWSTTADLLLGARSRNAGNPDDSFINMLIDDVLIMKNDVLTSEEITYLYNFGSGRVLSDTPERFIITASNFWNSTSLTKFNATIDGTTYYTTNGTLSTNLYQNDTSLYDITVRADDHIDRTFSNINITTNYEAILYQSIVKVYALEKGTNNTIINFTLTNEKGSYQTFSYYTIRYPNAGNYSWNFSTSLDYFSVNQTFNINPLFDGTKNFTNLYNARLYINATNIFSGNIISNFSGYAYNDIINESFSTSSGNVTLNLLKSNYSVYIDSPNYAIDNTTNYKTSIVNESFNNLEFKLYTKNSINTNIYNEDTGLRITGTNITIVVTGNLYEETFYTTTGTKYIDNLTDGEYTLKFSGGNYSLKTYVVTVAEKSTQNLNAYLSANYETVTFTMLDSGSGASLEGVSFTVERIINSSWTIVQSKSSDITGRVQINYIPNVKYRFTASNTGYVDKVFELDPVIFETYNVKLNRIISEEEISDNLVSVIHYPTSFINNKLNNLTVLFNSPSGLFNEYWIRINNPYNKTYYSNGSNSIGQSFITSLNISNATLLDFVNITIYYRLSTGESSLKTYYYGIGNITGTGSNTYYSNKNRTFGLGSFERSLIVVIILFIIVGLGYMFGSYEAGLGLGLFVVGYFMFLSFISLWVGLIIIFSGIILLIARNV